MTEYLVAAVERTMKVQEVILRAMARRITWWQAAEIIGISDRSMRRWKQRYEEHGYDGLFDRRRGKPSPKRVPVEQVEKVLGLYRDHYADLNVRHFHEKLREEHGTQLLHLDGSKHRWFQDERWFDLIEVLDDATRETYYAQLVEEESTCTVMAALKEVIEKKGCFCALYRDRASHFFETPKAGGPVDRQRLTQVGRALKELGIQMIPAYSPQARGRSERRFGTWQGRLPQELRLAGIKTVEEANRFLRERFIPEMNRKFSVPAAEKGDAFGPVSGRDLDRVFSVQQERVVGKDNTVQWGERVWQIERTSWRGTLAGCRVMICEHLDGRVTIVYGPHVVGRFSATGEPVDLSKKARAPRCGNDAPRAAWKTPKAKASFPRCPPRLEIRRKAKAPDSHIPTATTAAGGV